MNRITFSLLVLAVLMLAAVVGGCVSSAVVPAAGDLKKFHSVEEIRRYIMNNSAVAAGSETSYNGVWTGADRVMPEALPAAGESAAKGVSSSVPSQSVPDHSVTNVQVAGVDEPDFVKNDGRYIYMISGQSLAIVDAYPAASASIVSKTPLDDTPRDLFIDGDRLVLFITGTGSGAEPENPDASSMVKMMPAYYHTSTPVAHAIFYDISDRARPKVIKDFTIDGDYVDARLISNNLYVITREQIYPYDTDRITVPVVREGLSAVDTPDVYYFDNPEQQYAFTTISSFDIAAAKEREAKTYLVGSGNILYVSEDAMYISYENYHQIDYPMRDGPVAAVMPESIPRENIGSPGMGATVSGGAAVSPILWEDFNRMSESEKQAVIADMKASEADAIRNQEIDRTTTVIHKISILSGSITYDARGEVAGSLKDQFAMDEHDGNLRVATTSNVYTRQGQYEYNNVFVLDSGMKTIGTLTHIAEAEQIYATRFIGDRLYMVTFKRVDPFFVIDLSAPANPKILGRLKIPGFSDYLHPYDATHIIGLGKETGTNAWGGVSTQGLKLALFDVSDVEHPSLVDKVEIGDAGTDSAALTDHKAFLFDRAKNLLVIPARVVTNQPAIPDETSAVPPVQPKIWYGAWVFGVTPESGFTLRGTVEHGTDSSSYYWYGSSSAEVKRSLYIGDVLYTISSKQIKANSLSAINTTIATISLPDGGDILYPPLLPME